MQRPCWNLLHSDVSVFVICPLISSISQYASCTSMLARLQGYLIKEIAFFNIQKDLLGLWQIQSSPPKSVTVQFTAWRWMWCARHCWELRGKDSSDPPKDWLDPFKRKRRGVGRLEGQSHEPERTQQTPCSSTNVTINHLLLALIVCEAKCNQSVCLKSWKPARGYTLIIQFRIHWNSIFTVVYFSWRDELTFTELIRREGEERTI